MLKRLARVINFLVAVAAIAYFIRFAFRALSQVDVQRFSSPATSGAILLSSLGTVLGVTIAAWAWGRLLTQHCVVIAPWRLIEILGLTQIAKYLPGNIGHHIARSAMALRHGVPPAAVASSMALEALLSAGAAIVVAAFALGLLGGERSVLLLMVCVGMVLGATRLGEVRRSAALGYVLNYAVMGTCLYALTASMTTGSLAVWPLCIGAFSLAWVVGFLLPGAPAGLGVREGLLAALLTPAVPSPDALLVVLGFRVATTLGDLLSAAGGLLIRQHLGPGLGDAPVVGANE